MEQRRSSVGYGVAGAVRTFGQRIHEWLVSFSELPVFSHMY